jgi:hypothetical protein
MGPHDRIETWSRTRERVKHSLVCPGTGGVGHIHQGTCGNQTHSTLEIALDISILLREKEGWEITAHSGLSEVELSHHKETIPTPVDLRDHAHAPKGNLVY